MATLSTSTSSSSISTSNSNSNNSSSSSNVATSSAPPKISKFFSSAENYHSRIQQAISFSFTSSNFIFITCMLSISKMCTAAPNQAAAAAAQSAATASTTAGPHTAAGGLLLANITASTLLEKLNAFRATTLGPTMDRVRNSSAAAVHSIGNSSTSALELINLEFRFLNISGKLGTPLSIAQNIFNKCEEKQFQCTNGACIPIRYVCDGESDCADHSDEMIVECKFKEAKCGIDQFRCNNGKCIPNNWRCDQENDCADGSDEQPELCTNYCSSSQMQCKSDKQCIPRSWVCDGSADCPDQSDEANCNDTCRSDEFTCANGRCIQKRWVCDFDNDCGDNSDELACPTVACDEQKDYTCATGGCISKKWVCDGDPDCADGSDEASCANATQPTNFCQASEYACGDHLTCLQSSWVCDGERDCPDGDDELASNCKNVSCRPDQFQCRDRTCIPGHLTCNGQADCPDKSDEMHCSLSKITKCNASSEFDCGRGQCIPLAKVCDKQKDCPAGEDEPAGKCDVNECAINNGDCGHKCIDLPIGHRCDCQMGYKLSDNRTCVDINECDVPGSCSQICINLVGGYKCECEAGYMRDPRNHTRCKATEGHASLLLARRHDIRKIALDHMEMTSIVNNTKSATALDFVFRTGMIFWSDVTTQSIYKAPIDEGNDKTVVLKANAVTADGLAVDWIYNHIYFTDTHKCTLELTNFEGNMGKVLIEDELEIPRSIALDPIEGWMYWSDWGASPRIERAGMDGTHRTTIINYDVKWPNGITLDLVRKRIYWVDGKLNVIASANYDGSQRRQILYSTEYLRHPFSITTFEDYIYWTDWDKQTVFKANKFNGEGVEPITAMHMLQHPMVVHVYHPYRQPDGINHCQAVNGHCSHLCLPAPRINERSPRISCACPTGLKLMEDRLMCVEDLQSRQQNSTTKPKYTHFTNSKLYEDSASLRENVQHDSVATAPSNEITKQLTQTTMRNKITPHTTTAAAVFDDEINGNSNKSTATPEEVNSKREPYDTYPGEYLHAICEKLQAYEQMSAEEMRQQESVGKHTANNSQLDLIANEIAASIKNNANTAPLSSITTAAAARAAGVNSNKIAANIENDVDINYTATNIGNTNGSNILAQRKAVGSKTISVATAMSTSIVTSAYTSANIIPTKSPSPTPTISPARQSLPNSTSIIDNSVNGNGNHRAPDIAANWTFSSSRLFYRYFDAPPLYVHWLCRRMKLQQNRRPRPNVDKHPANNATNSDGPIIESPQPDSGYIALMVITGLVVTSLILAPILYFVHRQCSRRSVTAINFENPVYRKTTEDHFSLEKNLPAHMYASTVDEESRLPLKEFGTECVC